MYCCSGRFPGEFPGMNVTSLGDDTMKSRKEARLNVILMQSTLLKGKKPNSVYVSLMIL